MNQTPYPHEQALAHYHLGYTAECNKQQINLNSNNFFCYSTKKTICAVLFFSSSIFWIIKTFSFRFGCGNYI